MRYLITLILILFTSCSSIWEESYNGPNSDRFTLNINKVSVLSNGRYGGFRDVYYLIVTNPSQYGGFYDLICDSFISNNTYLKSKTVRYIMVPSNTHCTLYER